MAEEENLEAPEKQKETLELDKLEVSAHPAKPKEPPVSAPAKSEEKPVTQRGRWAYLLPSVLALVKNRTFLLSAVMALLIGAAVLSFIVSGSSPQQQGAAIADAAGKIVYVVSSPIGLGHYVEMRISVPFKDVEEKSDLINRLKDVRDALPRGTMLPEVTESIRNRDLDRLREQIAQIVCEITGLPTEKLDLEIASLN